MVVSSVMAAKNISKRIGDFSFQNLDQFIVWDFPFLKFRQILKEEEQNPGF